MLSWLLPSLTQVIMSLQEPKSLNGHWLILAWFSLAPWRKQALFQCPLLHQFCWSAQQANQIHIWLIYSRRFKGVLFPLFNGFLIRFGIYAEMGISMLTKYRPKIPVLAVLVPSRISKVEAKSTARHCLIHRGLLPVLAKPSSLGIATRLI